MQNPTDEQIRETVQRAYLHRQLREISKEIQYPTDEQLKQLRDKKDKNKIDNLNFSETQINAKEKRKK